MPLLSCPNWIFYLIGLSYTYSLFKKVMSPTYCPCFVTWHPYVTFHVGVTSDHVLQHVTIILHHHNAIWVYVIWEQTSLVATGILFHCRSCVNTVNVCPLCIESYKVSCKILMLKFMGIKAILCTFLLSLIFTYLQIWGVL